jgi:hypothetical protein
MSNRFSSVNAEKGTALADVKSLLDQVADRLEATDVDASDSRVRAGLQGIGLALNVLSTVPSLNERPGAGVAPTEPDGEPVKAPRKKTALQRAADPEPGDVIEQD